MGIVEITAQHPLPNQSECRKIYRYDGIYCESTYQNLQALRKEKSRDAARSRRGKENFEFYELAKLLPLPAAITSQLDKASIIRLTISYLKMRDFANQGDPPWNLRMEGPPPNTSVKVIGAQRRRSPSALAIEVFEAHLGSHILQSLDGFVFALNQEGKFLYISETVSIYLGLSQVELTGSSVFDYVHPGDHVEMAEQLGMKLPPGRGLLSQGTTEDGASSASSSSQSETPEPVESTSPSLLATDNTLERSFFIRMKSTLTKRGVHIKSSGYKVIHITGRLRLRVSLSHGRTVPSQIMGLVVVAHALPPPTINEVRIDCHMFVTRVNMDLNIIYCENRISDYMDLTPVDIVGKRCYHFIHAEDVEGIRHSHLDLLNKGQCVTKYYRWMQKNGGYIWIQSSATIAINAKNANEKNIIWVNYLLSNPEYKDTPMDIAQLPHLPEKTSESSETSDSESDSKDTSGITEDNENSKSDEKGNQSENSEDPEPDRKKSGSACDQDMNCNDQGHSSSNPDSRDSDDSFEHSDFENPKAGEEGFGALGPMQIKVERYVESEADPRLQSCESLTSDSAKDSDSAGEAGAQGPGRHQKRKKRRKRPGAANSLLYTGDLEALQRLQAGNVVLPLVHRVTGTLAATSTAAQRVYTTGTIRYAPAEVTLAMQGNLLPNAHAVNFVDVNSPGFGLDPKTPMEMLYHHVHRLNMSGPFGGAVSAASLTQMPAGNVFTTAEGLFSTLPFPVYSNGIHAAQTLERKDD
ncbi:PREDICTED: neuronal PAS domain-containing protein 3 [Miniopterus natalensis]|uniref:neuronal PAS domain-containing protein 3 n=1 Tax=Miniopterus natalensis TaxID=291302 RepID=UPI0007A6D1CF|nr:PREDICTED: neuronal PAS domain-containing protein 3 [Miniopterus natalensis]